MAYKCTPPLHNWRTEKEKTEPPTRRKKEDTPKREEPPTSPRKTKLQYQHWVKWHTPSSGCSFVISTQRLLTLKLNTKCIDTKCIYVVTYATNFKDLSPSFWEFQSNTLPSKAIRTYWKKFSKIMKQLSTNPLTSNLWISSLCLEWKSLDINSLQWPRPMSYINHLTRPPIEGWLSPDVGQLKPYQRRRRPRKWRMRRTDKKFRKRKVWQETRKEKDRTGRASSLWGHSSNWILLNIVWK